jgi:hypothetical protein
MTAVSRRRRSRWRAVGAFLKTLPGALMAAASLATAVASLATAVAGRLTALAQTGVLSVYGQIVVGAPAAHEAAEEVAAPVVDEVEDGFALGRKPPIPSVQACAT